ncbi:GNAT family N-acetyltransferase [Paraglaciecola sp.]|uniref:GNAT family N-acetyltransferase n=1 Tax=Paraglaciecola sp. TaxID=1920173 RepID=UPI003298099D
MYLSQVTEENTIELMSWFKNEDELKTWAGPNFSYPLNLVNFKRDLNINTLKSFALISKEEELLAFGQYYLKLRKCHLARLVVNPKFRGKGIAAHLIKQLITLGKTDLNTESCSLFVFSDNTNAINAYTKLGFSIAEYPEKAPMDDCLYMVLEQIHR